VKKILEVEKVKVVLEKLILQVEKQVLEVQHEVEMLKVEVEKHRKIHEAEVNLEAEKLNLELQVKKPFEAVKLTHQREKQIAILEKLKTQILKVELEVKMKHEVE
jgi:hypothetical protein